MLPPITIYLDSSDYSILSNPHGRTHSLDRVRTDLHELAKSGLVRFAFSIAHISEMAPLNAKYAPAAIARADLLVELCGPNAFISFDRLIASEIAHLANPNTSPVQPLSNDATWFPELGKIISPVKWADNFREEINQKTKEQGLNRQQRRNLKRTFFRENQPKLRMLQQLNRQNPSGLLNETLRLYPMRPQDAKVMGRYVLGQATANEAEDAFLESLRDPRWMMRWFAEHHDKLTFVTEWLRAPSRDMADKMEEIAANAKKMWEHQPANGPASRFKTFIRNEWCAAQDALLLNLANKMLLHYKYSSTTIESVKQVDRCCPGLSTAIRSLHSSLWDSVGINSNPRIPRKSDYLDAVHAMYAPYVTFFRADGYMTQHIRKQVVQYGTQVISHLDELPTKIHEMLHVGQ